MDSSRDLNRPSADSVSSPEAEVRVEQVRPDAVVTTLLGEHDLATRDATGALLRSLVSQNSLVVVNVSEAEFIDSSTISVLYDADETARACGSRLRLQMGTAPIVRRVLEISGILQQLEWASTREEALSQRASEARSRQLQEG